MEAHEYASIFPMLTEEKLAEVTEDIRENGLLDNIIRYKGKILDGRNRLLACQAAGVPPRFEDFEGDDRAALKFVMSKNLRRRHLTTGEAAMIGARYANAKVGGNRMNTIGSADPMVEITNAEAAAMVEVSERTIKRAKKVIKGGVPALEEMVKANKISVAAAAKIATLPEDEQDDLCAKGAWAIKEKAKEMNKQKKRQQTQESNPSPDATTENTGTYPAHAETLSDAAVKAGEAAQKDSKNLYVLKSTWKRASKKDCAAFLKWLETVK